MPEYGRKPHAMLATQLVLFPSNHVYFGLGLKQLVFQDPEIGQLTARIVRNSSVEFLIFPILERTALTILASATGVFSARSWPFDTTEA